MIESILSEGLIYSVMVLGVFITFRLLNFADMTVDGSFPLGACILAACLVNGINPATGLFLAFGGGVVSGLVTALIHTKLKIPGLLAGILTMTMLGSINLRIMGNRSNISYLKTDTLFTDITKTISGPLPEEWTLVVFLFISVLIIKIVLDIFFHTDFGLTLGAQGSNEQMIISQGMNPEIIKATGIALANGLSALMIISQGMNPEIIKATGIALANGLSAFSGAYASMYLGYADTGMGTGVVVSGLASLMLGEFVIRSNKISFLTLRVIIGSIIYRGIMYFGRIYGHYINLTANDLKLITGILIILCLVVSGYGDKFINKIRNLKTETLKKGKGVNP